MTGQEIITAFELQVDDMTELSSAEELTLLNRLYKKVCAARPWEFTKKTGSGVLDTSVPYVSLPADFLYFVANHNYTGNDEYAGRPVVFIGTRRQPYYVVSWSDRRQYASRNDVAYVDLANSRLVFTTQPITADAYEFDYHASPAALALGTSPIFHADFHPILQFAMATEDFVLQQSDKAKSYETSNQKRYDSYFEDLAYWNAQLVQM